MVLEVHIFLELLSLSYNERFLGVFKISSIFVRGFNNQVGNKVKQIAYF